MFNIKYTPRSFDEFIGNNTIVNMMKQFIKNDNIPNMILVGDHGIGKSTLCRLLLNEYFGDLVSLCSLEIYGSIDRGKNIMSEYSDKKKRQDTSDSVNVYTFISKTIKNIGNKVRIIVIYDFDRMTESAQLVLKGLIENKAERVRFIFICNDISNVSDALQSRATPILMSKIEDDLIIKRLKEIYYYEQTSPDKLDKSDKSNIFTDLDNEIYNTIALFASGDLKKAINYLQIFEKSTDKSINGFYSIFNFTPIDIICKNIISRDNISSFNMMNRLISDGFNASDILDINLKILISNNFNKFKILKDLNNEKRIKHLTSLCEIMKSYHNIPDNIYLYKLCIEFVKNNQI